MEPETHEITELLERAGQGDKEAEGLLYERVMPELRRIAHRLMAHERPNHTLEATELIGEIYQRLAGAQLSLRNRGHFFAIAARAMRRELIEYGRQRPDIRLLPLDSFPEGVLAGSNHTEVALLIDQLLDQLRAEMPLEADIVELKFFLGMTNPETAKTLDLPLRTMELKWQDARQWLFERCAQRGWKP